MEKKILDSQGNQATLTARLDLLGRLAGAYLAVADKAKRDYAEAASALADPAVLDKLEAEQRDNLIAAGEAFLERSNLAQTQDNAIHGESLWMAADSFDRAGQRSRAIDAFGTFVRGRPSDPRIPEALFRLGQDYQAVGQYDQAIAAYKANQDLDATSPRHPMAIECLIPMATCYIAQGEENYPQAEEILGSIIDRRPDITPKSEVYLSALFALGQLYYHQGKWFDAVVKLGEAIKRDQATAVPAEASQEQLHQRNICAARSAYIMAECYRQAATDARKQASQEDNLLRRDELRRDSVRELEEADRIYQERHQPPGRHRRRPGRIGSGLPPQQLLRPGRLPVRPGPLRRGHRPLRAGRLPLPA